MIGWYGRLAAFIAAVSFLIVLLPGMGSSASASEAPAEPDSAAAEPQAVVFAGVAGLAWEDVTPEDMPTLHAMAGTEAAAALTARTIRSRTCAVDGWLTVSSGRRSTDLIDSDGDGTPDRYCRPSPVPERDADGGATVPGWDEYLEEQENHAYHPRLGLVAEELAEIGQCATAVGPGAALALADPTGQVASYGPNPAEVDHEVMSACPVTVVDLGALPPPARAGTDEETRQLALENRRQVARGIDELIARLVDELPEDTALLIAGISDSGPTAIPLHNDPSHVAGSALRVAVATGPTPDGGVYRTEWLTSASTRWSGIVQLTDVSSTLLDYAGVEEPTAGSVGRPWRTADSHPADAEATVAELLSTNLAAQIYRTQSGPFFQLLGVVQLLFFGGALVVQMVYRGSRRAVLRTVHGGAIVIASFPVASYLANIVPWAQLDRPALSLWALILAFTAGLAATALLGPWRRRIYGPAGVVGAVTATVMAVDVSTGSNLQQLSLLGLSPVVAGRFYGLGNIPYAIFIAACLVGAGALAQWLTDAGRSRRFAGVVTAAIGLVATLVVGAPQAGADVGGILASIPAFAVLVIGVLGIRLTVVKLAAAGVGALAIFLAVAWLDWLRPPASRSHFGGFFEDLASGQAVSVILRKLAAAFGTLERLPYYAWLVPIAYLLIIWWVRRSGRNGVGGLRDARLRWPMIDVVIWSGLIAGAVGFAANDSGIIVPGLLLTAGVPLVVAAAASGCLAAENEPAEPSAVAAKAGR